MNTSVHRLKGHRILSIDCLRGFAMLFVILQHSYLSADMKAFPRLLDMSLWIVTSLAAVAFVSISGMVYSYFLFSAVRRQAVHQRYARRAAFLILAVHPAINLLSYPFGAVEHGSLWEFHTFLSSLLLRFPITDTIALCMLVAPPFIMYLSSWARAAVVVGMLLLSMVMRALVLPSETHFQILNEALFGSLSLPGYIWFPLVPWLAIFLTGSFIGEALARVKQGTIKCPSLISKMNRAAIGLALLGLAFTAGYKLLKISFGDVWNPTLFLAAYPAQTTSLLPGYLAVLLWVFSFMMQRIEVEGRYDRFLWLLSISGRTSLFTYVVQFAVVESAPALLGLKGTLGPSGFLVLFAVGQIAMWLLSYAYGRLRGWFRLNDYAEALHMVRTRCAAA